jgi:hypothetical protein
LPVCGSRSVRNRRVWQGCLGSYGGR